jgi:outer membrane protein assembly factor BamD
MTSSRSIKSLILVIVFLPAVGYAKLPKPEKLPADSVFLVGEELYREGRFRKAVAYLNHFVLNYPVKAKVALAQYHLADSYYRLKRFQEASVEYEFLYKQFSTSPFAEEAQLKAAQATFEISEPYYREQHLTLDSRRMAEDFLTRYPNSEFSSQARDLLVRIENKLARKELEAAKLYFKFKEYEAAIMMLEYTVGTYPLASKVNAEINYYLALSKAKLGEEEEAQAVLEELLENPKWSKKAQKALDRLAKDK